MLKQKDDCPHFRGITATQRCSSRRPARLAVLACCLLFGVILPAAAEPETAATETQTDAPNAPQSAAQTEPPLANSNELVLGMFAYRPSEILRKRWEPLAEYLSAQLPNHQVRLRLLEIEALKHALAQDQLDLVFTNPVHYIRLREQFEMTGALATLMRREQGQIVSRLGGVIITQAGRDDIQTLQDLKGRSILAAGPDFLGGYIAPLEALQAVGLRPEQIKFNFDPATHDAVVFAVLNGQADAGFVRTGILEQLQTEGQVDLADLTILGARDYPNFPFLVSSRLYPEWPIMALPGLDPEIGRQLAAALIQLSPEHPIAHAVGIAGFDLPADYRTLEAVMRTLQVQPFDQEAKPGYQHIWSVHYREISVLGGLAFLSIMLILALALNNRRLRQAQRQIATSEQRWLAALDGAGHGVWDWDRRTDKVIYSRRWKEMLGYREKEIASHLNEWGRRIHPDDLAETLKQVEAHRKGDQDQLSILHRLRAKDGSYRWMLGLGYALERDEDGQALRVIGTNTDLTRYHGAEIALADKESLFLALVNQAPNGMALVDPESMKFAQFNPALSAMLGYTKEEFDQLTITDLDVVHSLPEQKAQLAEIQRLGLLVFDTQLRRKGGQIRDVRISARCVTQNGKPYIATVFNDLTDLYRAQRDQLASQQDFQATFEQAAVGMAHLAPDGRYLRVNTKLSETLGYSSETLCQRNFQSITHPDDLGKNLNLVAQLIAGDIANYQLEKRYFHQSGEIVWVLVTMSLVRTDQGTPSYFIAVIEDIRARKQAEEQLHVAAQMVDLAAYAIIATDMGGVIRQFNPAAERLLGYTAENMIGHATPLSFHLDSEVQDRAAELSATFGEEIKPGFQVFTEPALREGHETREWRLRRQDGETLNVLLSTTVLRDSAGHPQGILGNIADISPLRRATEELRGERNRAQWYLETVSTMIVSVDLNGRITLANSYTCALLGRTESELLGQDWFETCVPEASRSRMRELFEGCTQDDGENPGCVESLVQCADGSERLIAWRNRLLHDPSSGQLIGVLAAGSDITERQALENARAAALTAAERLTRLKNNFLANMSHEIRTPLNGILGLTEIGRRDYDTGKAGRLFRQIQRAGEHLMVLLNDILDLSKLEAGKLSIHPEPVRLSETLAEIQSLLNPQVRAKGFDLIINQAQDLPEYILMDAMRLRQILLNLLGNAVKFTQAGEVRLTVSRDDQQLLFTVKDTGIGMSEAQMARIFQPFEQADAGTTRTHGGTGLGLAISRSLADMMGGNIKVDSQPNIGSCFELRLPLQQAQVPKDATPRRTTGGAPDQSLADLHILAVDDVELNLLVLTDLLGHRGAQVTTAVNGEDALAQLSAAPGTFDLVLMDVQMPVMDGYEAARRIRERWPKLPVIGLTAHAMSEERERCLNAGMVAHLTKPINMDALVAAIGNCRADIAHQDNNPVAAEATPADGTIIASPAPEPVGQTPDSQPDSQPGTQLPLVDWDALHQRFEHSPGFIPRLIQTALDSQKDTPARLRTIASEGNLDEFFRQTHSLKGFSGNLCAESLHLQADKLCEQARAGDQTALDNADSLAAKLEQVLEALAAQATPPDTE
ncbi:Autoinducer 2 sensor kinase/phosphatase LuxQ [Thiorhodovibrio litoralis]|nr:Autoinducer 2 sensor kinase/phosphatase LuxQ [Thiorhodovibrio litoralis]